MHEHLITVNDRMQRGYVYKLVEPEGRNFSPEFGRNSRRPRCCGLGCSAANT